MAGYREDDSIGDKRRKKKEAVVGKLLKNNFTWLT